jgi:hypothetical protein
MTPRQQFWFLETSRQLFDGTLEPADAARLKQQLTENVEARDLFVQFVSLVAGLEWSCGHRSERDVLASRGAAFFAAKIESSSANLGTDPTKAPLLSSVITSQKRSLSNQRRATIALPSLNALVNSTWVSTCLAAIVFYCTFSLLVWSIYTGTLRDRGSEMVTKAPREVLPSDLGSIATITAAEHSIRQTPNGSVAIHPGLRFHANESIDLLSGTAELTFKNGTRIIVEGPTKLEMRSHTSSFLERGKLVAQVPPKAVGFTIETPTASIVDLGTEFGVEVDAQKRTEVHVIRGVVQLVSGAGSVQRRETLQAGQARRVVGGTGKGATTIATEQLRFDAARFAPATQTKTAKKHRDQQRQIATARRPATLLLHYDCNDPKSWNGETLANVSGVGGADVLTLEDGTPRTQSNPNTVSGDFGAPVYVASGAISPVAPPLGATAVNHAYLSFQKYGILYRSDHNGSGSQAFNLDSVDPVEGYTLEAFLRLNLGYSAAEHTGIGFTAQAANENQFIWVARDNANTGNTALTSGSQTDNSAGAPQSFNTINSTITPVVPIGQWLHFVKVHDPLAEVVRFYTNGILVSTVAFPENGVEYNSNVFASELFGNVGVNGREIRGLDYSLFRAYRGVLTDAEILANFQEVAFVPIQRNADPATQRELENTQ